MNESENNAQLRERIEKENSEFNYEMFFRKYRDYGATVVITSEQSVSIVNEDDGRGMHDETQEKICRAIYNLGKKRGTERKKYKQLLESTIRFRVLNSGDTNPYRTILINFPETITKAQLEQLKGYVYKYGKQITKVKQEYDDLVIEFYNKNSQCEESIDDLQRIIDYAQTIPISRKKIKDDFIVGDTIHEEHITLLELLQRALQRGIGLQECDRTERNNRKSKGRGVE